MAHLGPEDVRDLIRLLPEALHGTVSHLLICQECRHLTSSLALQLEPPVDPVPLTSEVLGNLARIGDHRGRYEAALRQDEETADERYREWLAHPSRVEAALAEPRFQTPGMVRRLLLVMELLAEENPLEVDGLTCVAAGILARIDRRRYPAHLLVRLETMVCCLQSRACRARGQTRSALAVLRTLEPGIQGLPFDSTGRGLYLSELGLVRRDQGRPDEAAALLERAAKCFLLDNLHAFAGQANVEVGWTYLRARQPRAARQILAMGLALLGPAPLKAVLRARQGLAMAYAHDGQPGRARDSWSETRSLLATAPPAVRWRARAWEADLELACRAPRRAERLLGPCVEAFLEQRLTADAAQAALRLGHLLWRKQRSRDLEGLAGRVLPHLTEGRLFPRSRLVTAFAFGLALEGEPQAGDVLEMASRYLRYGRHNPDLPFHPRETVDGWLVWDGLDEARRRSIVEEAGLAPEIATQPAASLQQDIQDRIAWRHELRTGERIFFEDPEGDVLKPTEETHGHAITTPSWQHP